MFAYQHASRMESDRTVCRVTLAHVGKDTVEILPNYQNLVARYASNFKNINPMKFIKLGIFIDAVDIHGEFEIVCGKHFWNYHGEHLSTLDIYIAMDLFHMLCDILPRCPNLQSLTVKTDAVGTLRMPFRLNEKISFPNLHCLKVKGSPYLAIPLINAFILTARSLKDITFVCSTGWCPNLISISHVQLDAIGLITQAKRLKALTVQCASIHDKFIGRLTVNLGFQLERLTLTHSYFLTDISLIHIRYCCRNLKQLKIGNWHYETDYFAHVFHSLRRTLNVVSFSLSNSVNDETIASLTNLTCLAHLNISNCHKVTDIGISKLLGEKESPLITELHLVQLSITDEVIQLITPKLPNLEILNLSYARDITVESLEAMANHNRFLKCLSIHDCRGIELEIANKYGIELPSCINRMKELVHFSAKGLTELSRSCDKSLQLPNIQVLEYEDFISNITDVMKRCPSLKYKNNFSCKTQSYLQEPALTMFKKLLNIKCQNSPFGRCFQDCEASLDDFP